MTMVAPTFLYPFVLNSCETKNALISKISKSFACDQPVSLANPARTKKRPHPLLELGNLDRHAVGRSVVLERLVANLVLDELAEEERQDLLMVRRDSKVLPTKPTTASAPPLLTAYDERLTGTHAPAAF